MYIQAPFLLFRWSGFIRNYICIFLVFIRKFCVSYTNLTRINFADSKKKINPILFCRLATLVFDASYNDLYYCQNQFEKTKSHPLQTSSNKNIFLV